MLRSSIAAAAFALVSSTALAQGQPPGLPDGPGKEQVEAVCAGCHVTGLIPAALGYTRDHWKELIGTMIDLSGSPDQQNDIIDYLATNFPPNKRRKPTVVPGNSEVTFKEWVMPQLGQRTRDPMQPADGSIWYAGQFGNLIGRLDPSTGQAKEYPLPANSHAAHRAARSQGPALVLGQQERHDRLDRSRDRQGDRLQDARSGSADPHTITFDKKGIVYFTFQAPT